MFLYIYEKFFNKKSDLDTPLYYTLSESQRLLEGHYYDIENPPPSPTEYPSSLLDNIKKTSSYYLGFQ
tara:strand:+ start:10079 stop:10282 length:204 start_codon:yes stop_codon:yes gene_type:complete